MAWWHRLFRRCHARTCPGRMARIRHAVVVGLAGTLQGMRWPVERSWASAVLFTALALAGFGVNSGTAVNTETVPEGTRVFTVECGSPWAPDDAEAARADLAIASRTQSVLHACRDHNDLEALVADAATPGGLLIALIMLGVIGFETADARRYRQGPRHPRHVANLGRQIPRR